jgi:hypothetical protein
MIGRKPFENGSTRAASAKGRFCAASVAGSSPRSLGLRVGTAYRRRSGAGIWEMSVKIKESMRAVFGRDNPHGALSRKHRAERIELASALRPQTRSAIRQIGNSYRRELAQPERIQHQETQALQERHSRESQERAQEIAQGRDVQQFRKETGPSAMSSSAAHGRRYVRRGSAGRKKKARQGPRRP